MIWAVIWLVAFVLMVGGLAGPSHTVKGYPAALIFGAQFVSGLALAIHAL